MNRKKFLTVLLVCLMAMTMLPVALMAEEVPAGPAEYPAEGYPIQLEDGSPLQIVYWAPLNGNVSAGYTNLGDTPIYQELMERTGVEIEFLHPAAGNDVEALTLMLSGGDLPDVIEYSWRNFAGGPAKAINDYAILPLNDLIAEHAPALSSFLDKNDDVKQQIMTDDGVIYSFPFVRGDENLQVSGGLVIREDWLNDLGLEVPETIEDWEVALTAFKDEKGATAPLTYEPYTFPWANFQGAYGVGESFYLKEDGSVAYGPIEPGYKDFLETFSRWYQNGLIDPDIATATGQTVNAYMTNGQAGATTGWVASRIGVLMSAGVEQDENYSVVGTPNPVTEGVEVNRFGQYDFAAPPQAVAITPDAEYPELVAKFLDYGYTDEGHLLMNFGIEGVSYEMIDGYPTYTETVTSDPEIPFAQALASYVRSNYNGPFVQDIRYAEQYFPLPQQQDAYQLWASTSLGGETFMPPVTPSEDESRDFATIMNEVEAYKGEMFTKFLMGDEPIENFDAYVETIKGMNIDRAIEIQEAALERYNGRLSEAAEAE